MYFSACVHIIKQCVTVLHIYTCSFDWCRIRILSPAFPSAYVSNAQPCCLLGQQKLFTWHSWFKFPYLSIIAQTGICAVPCSECMASSEHSLGAFWWTLLCLGTESIPPRQTCGTKMSSVELWWEMPHCFPQRWQKSALWPVMHGNSRSTPNLSVLLEFCPSHLKHPDTLPRNEFCQSEEMSFIWVTFPPLQTCVKHTLGKKKKSSLSLAFGNKGTPWPCPSVTLIWEENFS